MNLLAILKERIEAIPEGEHTLGLTSVLQHIEVATRHFERGQTTSDDAAFTDAIYRTNQAFEGSLKEAYRVVAGKNPDKVRPFDIEEFFSKNNELRPRVLSQFKDYRTNWRNPSTHDYRLNFDNDEALLAIVTVTAFAVVLADQIAWKIAYQKEEEAAAAMHQTANVSAGSLFEESIKLIIDFAGHFQPPASQSRIFEAQVLGALSGFFSGVAPDLTASFEYKLSEDSRDRPDVVLTSQSEKVLIEVKSANQSSPQLEESAIHQVVGYLTASGIKRAVIFIFTNPNSGHVSRKTVQIPLIDGLIEVITTQQLPG